jgi:hypothetical protein
MNRRRVVACGVLLAVVAACGGDDTEGAEETSGSETSGSPTTGEETTGSGTTDTQPTTPDTAVDPTPPPTEPTTPETTPETIPVVTSDIVGVAVAGNSGGVGADATDSFSEVVRNEDGTCSGWAGRDVAPPWTDGLESGAPFVILAREGDEVLGEGTLATSSFEDVGVERQQWVCSFPFEATINGAPEEFRIKVADLDPWVVRRDPTDPARFVTSVNTVVSVDYFPDCTSEETFEVTEWSSVGSYWSDGISSLCANGLKVVDIARPCRQRDQGSDYVTLVTSANQPDLVLENADGVQVDVSTLAPGEPVIVHVATGRPC